MDYNAAEIWDANGVLEEPIPLGGHSYIFNQEKIPVHPDGYVLWRGFMSEKAKLNGVQPKEKKKENSILN